ncbi:hypothetical protein AD945_10830 [Gluconobacter albidus]|uniref:Uncharacterized protein n=1 Tax=Gluconobacter albidus TaxID=318683 RepID=A0A149TGW0_9PROT|nr:hypothetical protein [Gluconobacter albidus]KXV47096.1 hypothetical protein AD945_10830 [Gluconobacter albidus]
MAKPAKQDVVQRAFVPGEITELFHETTDQRFTSVNVGPEAREVIRDFLMGLDPALTVESVIAALEEEWS